MKLKGAVINVLGDSITEGAGASCTENRYTDVLAREFGAKVNNYGIGGTRIARQRRPSDNPRWDLDFCGRAPLMDESADAVVVLGGVNDHGHGDAPFGTFADRDPSTFCGACHTLMTYLTEHYTGKPVVIATPLHCLGEDGSRPDRAPEDDRPLRDFRDAIRRIAEYYGFPVLDLYAESGMQPANAVCRERLMPDGLHPNDAGHAIIAHRIGHFLERM